MWSLSSEFDILDEIGRGSYSEVVRAREKSTGILRAIKVINLEGLHEKELVNLDRELKILNELKGNPNIVQIVDVREDTANNFMFLVFELCQGGDLLKCIRKHKKLSEDTACRLFAQMVVGMQLLWSRHFIHRDLKPANLLLSTTDPDTATLKVADFGFVRKVLVDDGAATLCGSPLYMAPEVVQSGRLYDYRADLWSMGVLLYEMVSGVPAFYSPAGILDIHNVIHAQADTIPVKAQQAGASPELVDLLRKIITIEPVYRISATELEKHPFVVRGFRMMRQPDLPTVETAFDGMQLQDLIASVGLGVKSAVESESTVFRSIESCGSIDTIETTASPRATNVDQAQLGHQSLIPDTPWSSDPTLDRQLHSDAMKTFAEHMREQMKSSRLTVTDRNGCKPWTPPRWDMEDAGVTVEALMQVLDRVVPLIRHNLRHAFLSITGAGVGVGGVGVALLTCDALIKSVKPDRMYPLLLVEGALNLAVRVGLHARSTPSTTTVPPAFVTETIPALLYLYQLVYRLVKKVVPTQLQDLPRVLPPSKSSVPAGPFILTTPKGPGSDGGAMMNMMIADDSGASGVHLRPVDSTSTVDSIRDAMTALTSGYLGHVDDVEVMAIVCAALYGLEDAACRAAEGTKGVKIAVYRVYLLLLWGEDIGCHCSAGSAVAGVRGTVHDLLLGLG